MPVVMLKTATHIHALPGAVSVSDAECARLCALGVAEPVPAAAAEKVAEAEPAEEPKQKKTRRKAGK